MFVNIHYYIKVKEIKTDNNSKNTNNADEDESNRAIYAGIVRKEYGRNK